jgi:hypothetical protein
LFFGKTTSLIWCFTVSVRDEINSLLEECRELELAGDVAAVLRKALQAQEIALA